MAVYSPEANKTFFVYGGKSSSVDSMISIMAGYYDHTTGMLPRPTIVLEKNTIRDPHDAHHNPTLSIDEKGYLWVFASAHGGEDGFIYRSAKPYSIDAFEQIAQKEFTYPQPSYRKEHGHILLFTKYMKYTTEAGVPKRVRQLYVSISRDGKQWSKDKKIAGFNGHYQVSWAHSDKRGTAFNWHPPKGGLNARTNLYYMESGDYGRTWTNAAGKRLVTPLHSPQNGALVREYQKEGLLVYLQDLNFDRDGRPVILYTLTRGYEPGPKNGPRFWTTARWTGEQWEFRTVATSDHNYDCGSLYIEDDGTWRVIGPTEPGPQRYGTGGEMAMWTSSDQGKTWTKVRDLTRDSKFNHTYARRPLDAHPDFYTFWADGDPLKASESRLYFANKAGEKVYMLPDKMAQDFERPVAVDP